MKKTHVVGLVLWRGGLLVVAGTIAYWTLRELLKIADPRLELAVALVLTGVVFVFLSIVVERIGDSRVERSELK